MTISGPNKKIQGCWPPSVLACSAVCCVKISGAHFLQSSRIWEVSEKFSTFCSSHRTKWSLKFLSIFGKRWHMRWLMLLIFGCAGVLCSVCSRELNTDITLRPIWIFSVWWSVEGKKRKVVVSDTRHGAFYVKSTDHSVFSLGHKRRQRVQKKLGVSAIFNLILHLFKFGIQI